MNLSVKPGSDTGTTLILVWTPPANVGGYVLYANGQPVSVTTRNNKDGSPRTEAKFHKTSPGAPFQVAAVCRNSAGTFMLDVGTYPTGPKVITPSTSTYPSEVMP